MLENYMSQSWEITSQLHTGSREECELEGGSVNWKEEEATNNPNLFPVKHFLQESSSKAPTSATSWGEYSKASFQGPQKAPLRNSCRTPQCELQGLHSREEFKLSL